MAMNLMLPNPLYISHACEALTSERVLHSLWMCRCMIRRQMTTRRQPSSLPGTLRTQLLLKRSDIWGPTGRHSPWPLRLLQRYTADAQHMLASYSCASSRSPALWASELRLHGLWHRTLGDSQLLTCVDACCYYALRNVKALMGVRIDCASLQGQKGVHCSLIHHRHCH